MGMKMRDLMAALLFLFTPLAVLCEPVDPSREPASADQGKLGEAIPALEKAAAADPKSYRAALELGLAYLSDKQYQKARVALERAAEIEIDQVVP